MMIHKSMIKVLLKFQIKIKLKQRNKLIKNKILWTKTFIFIHSMKTHFYLMRNKRKLMNKKLKLKKKVN